jgi:transposase
MATERHYLETVLNYYHPDLVVIEACSIAGWVHDVCTSKGYQVLVCNPAQEPWKWKHLKRKTDRDDALKIAKLAALDQLVPVYIPGRDHREFRSLVNYRKVVLGRRNRVQNHIRAIFDQRGMSMTRGLKAWTLGRREELTRPSKPLADCARDELWRGELDLELAELARLSAQLAQLDKKLSALGIEDERVRLLRTIPGVGPRTAEVVVAYLDDARRFKNARQVSSYAGLVPRRYQSGQMDRHGRIHKRGPRLLRSALVEAAWIMLRLNPWARGLYEHFSAGQKTRKKKAIVAIARKLLVRCWVMLLRKEPWRAVTQLAEPVGNCA